MVLTDSDRIEIIAVQNAFAVASDAFRWDWLERLFTADVVFEHRQPAGTIRWDGFDAWRRHVATVIEPNMLATQHLMLNHLVTVDGCRARAFCYALVKVLAKTAATTLVGVTTHYDDELVRDGAGWRISRRTVQNILAREVAEVPGAGTLTSVAADAASRIAFLHTVL